MSHTPHTQTAGSVAGAVLTVLLVLASAALLIRFALTAPVGPQGTAVVPASIRTPALPPCPTEDAPGPCYWDAQTMGNGVGESFTVDAFGNITYQTDKD